MRKKKLFAYRFIKKLKFFYNKTISILKRSKGAVNHVDYCLLYVIFIYIVLGFLVYMLFGWSEFFVFLRVVGAVAMFFYGLAFGRESIFQVKSLEKLIFGKLLNRGLQLVIPGQEIVQWSCLVFGAGVALKLASPSRAGCVEASNIQPLPLDSICAHMGIHLTDEDKTFLDWLFEEKEGDSNGEQVQEEVQQILPFEIVPAQSKDNLEDTNFDRLSVLTRVASKEALDASDRQVKERFRLVAETLKEVIQNKYSEQEISLEDTTLSSEVCQVDGKTTVRHEFHATLKRKRE